MPLPTAAQAMGAPSGYTTPSSPPGMRRWYASPTYDRKLYGDSNTTNNVGSGLSTSPQVKSFGSPMARMLPQQQPQQQQQQQQPQQHQQGSGSLHAWQMRCTSTPLKQYESPMGPDYGRGRSRVTNIHKTRTPSPVHSGAFHETRLPRSSSPTMHPPKRVFSTPPAYEREDSHPFPSPASPRQQTTTRRPSMLWDGSSQFIIQAQAIEDRGKYCVVLDLDETIVYARDGPIKCRPGYRELIAELGKHCETVVWTAGERSYAKEVLKQIDPTSSAIRHCIYRHHLWFDGRLGQVKDLRLLGREPDRVLLVENTPDCLRKNATQSILVPDFRGTDNQGILNMLTRLINDMVKSSHPVAQFLRSSHLVTPREVSTNVGDTIICHTLGDSDENFSHRAPNPDTLPSYSKKKY
eukprot:TRINITY_DN1878_c12_g1_i1.p1 TRINITY_DN1878_c12_g1~~TRINITY_DN1878_c12_g1_i1.p1  ORF type:complete len:408 (+),score=71.27 TRINITY_DN1878_c12_g1_i1:84-1307(+)